MEDEQQRRYRDAVISLVNAGEAKNLLDCYSEHNQSCAYVYGILQHFAYEVDTGISDEIVNFARNLLDDWSK